MITTILNKEFEQLYVLFDLERNLFYRLESGRGMTYDLYDRWVMKKQDALNLIHLHKMYGRMIALPHWE